MTEANDRVATQANGRAAVRDPAVLIREIETTRENLARTIDALAERVSPGNITRRALARAGGQTSRPEVQLVAASVTIAAAGLVVYLILRRRRR